MTYIHCKCLNCKTIYSYALSSFPSWKCEKCGMKDGEQDPWYSYFLSRKIKPIFNEETLWSVPVRDGYWKFEKGK